MASGFPSYLASDRLKKKNYSTWSLNVTHVALKITKWHLEELAHSCI